MTHTDHYLLAARAALDAGDPRQAYMLVTSAMLSDPGRSDLYMAASESLRWLGQPRLAGLYELAAARSTDHEVILGLAQEILAIGDAPLAVDIARRAVALKPGSLPALGLLALALAADFRPAEGRNLLLDYSGLDFEHGFARAWCSLLCGEIDPVLRFIEDTRVDLQSFRLDPGARTHRESWLHYIEECLARRVTVEDPSDDLRTWHFIQYGAAIMTASPNTQAAGGRFMATWKSYREVSAILKALHDMLIRIDRRPAVVVAAPGRDAAIVGRVAAEFLGVPFSSDADPQASAAHALIVAAHGSNLAGLPIAATSRGQTVFALDFNWLTPGHAVPDICGMLSLSCTLPWHGETRIALSAAQLGTRHVPAESEVVQRILNAEGDTDASAVGAMPFYVERAGDLKGHRAGSQRERFRRDSPVRTVQTWRGYV